jgi:hypothetical protein
VDVVGGGWLDPEVLGDWCRREIGSSPTDRLFETVRLSVVIGLRMADGQEVVIKVRAMSPRVDARSDVQRHLFSAGFPCPEPLAGPSVLGSGVATAERYVASGSRSPPRPIASRSAILLADLIAKAPPAARFASIEPGPAWVDWDDDRRGTWPSPDDLDIDLNDCPGPDWVDRAAQRLRSRLGADDAVPVIGHVDWEVHNIGGTATSPSSYTTGTASPCGAKPPSRAQPPPSTPPGGPIAATIDQTGEFLRPTSIDGDRGHKLGKRSPGPPGFG